MLSVVSGATVVLLVALAKATKPNCILQISSDIATYSSTYFPDGPDQWRAVDSSGNFLTSGYKIQKEADGRLGLVNSSGQRWSVYWPAAGYSGGCITNVTHAMENENGDESFNHLYVVDDNYPTPKCATRMVTPNTLLGRASSFAACVEMVKAANGSYVVWHDNVTAGNRTCYSVTGTPDIETGARATRNGYRVLDMRHAYPRIGTTNERILVAKQADFNACRETAKKEVGLFEYITVHKSSGDCYVSTKHDDLEMLVDGSPNFDLEWRTLHKPSTTAELGDVAVMTCTKKVSA